MDTEISHFELLCVKSNNDRFLEGHVYYAEPVDNGVVIFDRDNVQTDVTYHDEGMNEFKVNGCIFI